MQAQTALGCDPRSVRAARRFVTELLFAERLQADLVDTAALLVTELVTNAVLHARSAIELSVTCHRDWARVDVADAAPRAIARRSQHLDATTGRGLLLMDLLASTWGVEPSPDGKTVWFEVRPAGPGDRTEPDLDGLLSLDSRGS